MTARTFAHPTAQAGFAAPSAPAEWGAWLPRAWRAHVTRRELARLDAHLLRDIGVDRLDARREAERPFWDL